MSTLATTIVGAAPRLGFLGLGWIGRARLQTLAASGAARISAISDISPERLHTDADTADAVCCDSFDDLLEQELDGVVIATPSALHAEQARRALERGLAVFCQKPLARTAAEARAVIEAARNADRLLGIDLSYRYTAGMRAVRDVVTSGAIGTVHAVELTFHNAYGPDRAWARDPRLAGGGCVIDLGTHLVDLAWWILDAPQVRSVSSQLYAHGRRLPPAPEVCEDLALATFELDDGVVVRMACSWESSTGRDAVIEVGFTGTEGAVVMRNVNGSFYDFEVLQFRGTATRTLVQPPDDWGGRALVEWSRRLGSGERYDAGIETVVDVAAALDAVLGR
jgi:predicted dehydrogenase